MPPGFKKKFFSTTRTHRKKRAEISHNIEEESIDKEEKIKDFIIEDSVDETTFLKNESI